MAQIRYETITATIANGAALSGAVNVLGREVVGIQMPSAWTAAAMTFDASADGQTYRSVVNTGGTETSYTVAASTYIVIAGGALSGMHSIKVRSGTTGTPVNQGAERLVLVVVRALD